MLTKGLRDEEQERIKNILARLMALVYVPDGFPFTPTNEILAEIGLSFENLSAMEPLELVERLKRLHFDFENAETFGDYLCILHEHAPNGMTFKPKALSVYQYIQTESKSFSFGIAQKIHSLQP